MDIAIVGELKGTIIAPVHLTGVIEQSNTLTGTITTSVNSIYFGQLKAVVSNTASLVGKISVIEPLKGVISVPLASAISTYEGSYEIIPKVNAQIVETRSKTMKDDLTVLAIPYYETSNPTGKTVYIGGE